MNGKMNKIRESINTLTQKMEAKEKKWIVECGFRFCFFLQYTPVLLLL